MGIINLFISMATKKNTLGGMFKDEFSDDDVKPAAAKKVTNKKLEGANKQSHKADAAPRYNKMNANQAVADGFEIAGTETYRRAAPGRGRGGERGAFRGGERGRGGRGGRGGERGRGGPRPATAGRGGREAAVPRLDADGNPVVHEKRGAREHRGRDNKHEGKDREDGTGRARRERKEGGERNYKKKGEEGEAGEAAVEEVKVEEAPKVVVPEVVYEVIGESLDDFLGGNAANIKSAKDVRATEGIKGVKTVEGAALNTAKHNTLIV